MKTTEREQLLNDAGHFAHELTLKMYATKDIEELKRLDKVAMRLTSFMGSLARYRRPEDSLLSASGSVGGSQEQDEA